MFILPIKESIKPRPEQRITYAFYHGISVLIWLLISKNNCLMHASPFYHRPTRTHNPFPSARLLPGIALVNRATRGVRLVLRL